MTGRKQTVNYPRSIVPTRRPQTPRKQKPVTPRGPQRSQPTAGRA